MGRLESPTRVCGIYHVMFVVRHNFFESNRKQNSIISMLEFSYATFVINSTLPSYSLSGTVLLSISVTVNAYTEVSGANADGLG